MNKGCLKERLKNGQTVIGTWNIIPSPSLIEAIGYSGLDFVIIDTEHGPASIESAENLIRAADVSEIASVIRVPHNDSYFILRALDIGAHGIQVPHVSTKEEAELVVKYSKYHPEGERGLSPFTRAAKYGIDKIGHVKRSNKNTVVVINVEGAQGIRNLNEISSVSGIDVIFIGPYDLSQSLGKPGQVENSEVIDAIRRGVNMTKQKGLACGSFADSPKLLETLLTCGVQYISYAVDSVFISQAYRDLYKTFNEKISANQKIKV